MTEIAGAIKPLADYANRPEYKALLEALKDKQAGRITQEELGALCHRWAFHYALNDLGYKPLPKLPTYMQEYQRLSFAKKQQCLKEESGFGRKVKEYLAKISQIKVTNDTHLIQLKAMLHFFEMEENNQDKVPQIRRVINDYPKADKVWGRRA